MDHTSSRGRDLSVDLESGGTTSEEDGIKDPVFGDGQGKNLLSRVWSGSLSFDGSVRGEDSVNSCDNIQNSAEVSAGSVDLSIDKKSGEEEIVCLLEKKLVKEKRKKTSSKKPPKPPRPPRGPFLDAADQKLVREITELAMLKRARIERMKALKKMKVAKAASSNSSLCAMVITILFCLVIIFQGICSRSTSRLSFHGSPEPAVALRGGLISVQYYKNASASETGSPGSGPSNLLEQVSGSDSEEKGRRVTG